MVDKYTTTDLVIDDMIGALAVLKALSLYHAEKLDINLENIYDKAVLDMINLYNRFNSSKYSDSYEDIATIEAHLE